MIDETGREKLQKWYRGNGRHELPWREQCGPWEVLVAETLLHRTRASKVAEVYPEVIARFNSPLRVIEDRALWLEMTSPLGLSWRAVTFVRACEMLVYDFNNEVPEDRTQLLSLPGVGHYVADAVRCFGFHQAGILVDTNTIRVASRILAIQLDPRRHRSGKVRDAVGELWSTVGPPKSCDNYALLDLAALVCLPDSPICEKCPLNMHCQTATRKYILSDEPTAASEDQVDGSQ